LFKQAAMKRIFVPVDFSPCSENALDYAIKLGKRYGAEIYAVHGFNPSSEIISSDFVTPFQGVPGTLSADQLSDFIKERNDFITKQLAEIVELGKRQGAEIKADKIDSAMFDDLADKAKELNCDLVVMGSHGSKGIEEALIGSNTQKFVRNSKIPVMVIKQPPQKLNNIAFFSTFTKEGEKKIYKEFIELFNNSQSKVHFVYVNTPSNFLDTPTSLERINSFIEETKPENYDWHIYNENSVEEGVMGFAEHNDIDLVVLATHGYTGLKRFFHHSYTESIINHIELPVLTFGLDKSND
jgi:nucleotide-binding universal stress UspA family protein